MTHRKWYYVLLADGLRMLPYLLLVPLVVLVQLLGAALGANDYTVEESIREAIGPQCVMMAAVGLVYLAINGLRFRDWMKQDRERES